MRETLALVAMLGVSAAFAAAQTSPIVVDQYVVEGIGAPANAAISGDTVVYGNDFAGNLAPDGGLGAEVFVRSVVGGATTWNLQTVLAPMDGAVLRRVGYVSLAGDTLLATTITGVRVYERSGVVWTETANLLPSDVSNVSNLFGVATDVGGDTVVVGAPNDDEAAADAGAAYVFVRVGATWTATQKLLAPDANPNAHFGRAVALSGDTIVVGAPDAVGPYAFATGKAYVFTRTADVWSHAATISTSDTPFILYRLGASVDVDGDFAVAGAPTAGAAAGHAVVLRNIAGSWGVDAVLTPADSVATQINTQSGDTFGASVSISGDFIAVGAPQHDLWPFDAGYGADDGISGVAYVFRRVDAAWEEIVEFIPDRMDVFTNSFGAWVAMSGGTIVTNVVALDARTTDGSVIFTVTDGNVVVDEPLDPTTGTTPVSLVFQNVTEGGTSTVVTSTTGPELPSGFQLGDPPLYYEIGTTNAFTGGVEVTVYYPPTAFADESTLQLLHYENGAWVNVTTYRDPIHNFVRGVVTSFSPFVVARFPAMGLLTDLEARVANLGLQHGLARALDAKLKAAQAAIDELLASNVVAARNELVAFVNAVAAQAGKKIPSETAASLIADAAVIIALLS